MISVTRGPQGVTSTLAILALLATASGCGRELYYWGHYEESIHNMYLEADSFDLASEIDRLSVQVEEAQVRGRLVPPGLHAHLALLHSLAGDDAAAVSHLMIERELFPESSTFIDGMIERMRRG